MPVLETVRRYTPLGLRFWDAATESRVIRGPQVRLWPEGAPQRSVHGFATADGDVAADGIPGLGPVERTGEIGAVPPSTYVAEVTDPANRFVNAVFTLDLPRSEPGFFTLARPESPPEPTPPGIYLFSAPTRPIPTSLAVVRASLRDADTGEPAAFAALRVELLDGSAEEAPPEDRLWAGLSDATGNVQVVFPYPRLPLLPRSSPPGEGRPLYRQEWSLRVRVHYAPSEQDRPTGADAPTLTSVFGQPAATLIEHSTGPVESTAMDVTLRHRVPAVVRTAGLGPEEKGWLLLRPGSSPP